MKDEDAIQGLWRLVKRVSGGQQVHDCVSHYLFRDGVYQEIIPDEVDDGTLRCTYRLEPRKRPKRIFITLDWNGPDGPPDPNAMLLKGFYEIEGDTLRLCMGCDQDFPAEFSDAAGSLILLTRDKGPMPETKKPSGTPPIDDEVLGRLIWDDNLDWWETKVRVGRGSSAEFFLSAPRKGKRLESALQDAREFLHWLRANERAAREFAAEQLLDLHNDEWNKGKPTSKSAFMKRMKLESVCRSSRGATLYYRDGDLFLGHSITIELTKQGTFKRAGIAG
jgi:uncharacterized protein (TIGR03067 family)